MSLLDFTYPWTKQPQYPIGINKSNPLGKLVVYASNPGLTPSSQKWTETYVGSVTTKPSVRGIGRKTPGTGQDYWYIDKSAVDAQTTGAIGIVFGGSTTLAPNSGVFSHPLVCASTTATRSGFILMLQNNTSKMQFQCYNTTSTAAINIAGTTALNDGKYHVSTVDWSHASGATTNIYVDGVLEATGANAAAWAFAVATGVTFLNSIDTFWGNYDGDAPLVVLFSRPLTLTEHKSFYANPWQIFQPLSRNIFVESAGGGSGVASGDIVFTSSVVGASANKQAVSGDAVFTASIVGASAAVAPASGAAVFTASVVGSSSAQASSSGNVVFTSAIVGDSAAGGQGAASGDTVFTSSIVGASAFAAVSSGNIVFTSSIISSPTETAQGDGKRDAGWDRFKDLKPLKRRLRQKQIPDEVIEVIEEIILETDIQSPVKNPVSVLRKELHDQEISYSPVYGEILKIELKLAIQQHKQMVYEQEEEELLLLMAA